MFDFFLHEFRRSANIFLLRSLLLTIKFLMYQFWASIVDGNCRRLFLYCQQHSRRPGSIQSYNGAGICKRRCVTAKAMHSAAFFNNTKYIFWERKKMLCGKRGLHAVMSDLIMHFFSRYNVSMALLFVQFFNQVGVAYKTSEGMLSFFFSFLLHLLNILE